MPTSNQTCEIGNGAFVRKIGVCEIPEHSEFSALHSNCQIIHLEGAFTGTF